MCDVLCEAVNDMGWKHPSSIQRQALPHAFEGNDIIGLAETGSGKTGAFVLPILQVCVCVSVSVSVPVSVPVSACVRLSHSLTLSLSRFLAPTMSAPILNPLTPPDAPTLHPQRLLEKPQRMFALCLAPTRELAVGIKEQFEALGACIGLKCALVIGGVTMMSQAIQLSVADKPHVIVATPGRLVDLLENSKGFSLMTIKMFVLDEADRMLSLDFEESIDKLLAVRVVGVPVYGRIVPELTGDWRLPPSLQNMPRDRTTYLYSATMTSKVQKLQRASLNSPVRVEATTSKYSTVDTLIQQYLFIPAKHKDCYLAYVLNNFSNAQAIVFTATCANTDRCALMLRNLGFKAVELHGQMAQVNRLGALNKFKSGKQRILLATDVASRGLDIPAVDLVLNFDLPATAKDYVHRVGRTARAGRAGRAITFVTQYDVEAYQRIEKHIEKKLPAYPADSEEVLVFMERVTQAQRMATNEMKERSGKGGGGKKRRKHMDELGDPTDEAAAALEDSVHKRAKLKAVVRRNKQAAGGGGGGGGGGGKRKGRR